MKPVSPSMLLAVCSGGVVGGLLRYLVGLAAPARTGAIPWTTLAVNVAGAALLGLLAGVLERHPRPLLRAMLGSGVLGGFTTFSGFECELRLLGAQEDRGAFAGYLVLSLVAGLVACAGMLRVGRRLVPDRETA